LINDIFPLKFLLKWEVLIMRVVKAILLIVISTLTAFTPFGASQSALTSQGLTWCSSAFAYVDFYGIPFVSSARGRGGSTWYSSDGTYVIASISLYVEYLTWYFEQGTTMSISVDEFSVPAQTTEQHRMNVFASFPASWHASGVTFYNASDGVIICGAHDYGHGGI
jgi:hypothetical protein